MFSIPVYSSEGNIRQQYIDFLVRTNGLNNSKTGGKIPKSLFIEKCGLNNRTARDLWNRGAKECEYFRACINDNLFIRRKTTRVIAYVEKETAIKIKTLPDFKLFITCLQAGIPNEYGNRSRTLKKIGEKTGTEYKTTVSRRVQRAKKLGLDTKHRYIRKGEYTPQISNAYTLFGVKFAFNKIFYPLCKNQVKAMKNQKKVSVALEICKRGIMPPSCVYSDYSLWWN